MSSPVFRKHQVISFFFLVALDLEMENDVENPPENCEGCPAAIIAKIRDACRDFHRKPAKNDDLLKISQTTGCNLKIVLDVQIRWNSTLRMLRNFVAQEEALRLFYAAGKGDGEFPLTHDEMRDVRLWIAALTHVEVCSKRLSAKNRTLHEADLAFQVSYSHMTSSPL